MVRLEPNPIIFIVLRRTCIRFSEAYCRPRKVRGRRRGEPAFYLLPRREVVLSRRPRPTGRRRLRRSGTSATNRFAFGLHRRAATRPGPGVDWSYAPIQVRCCAPRRLLLSLALHLLFPLERLCNVPARRWWMGWVPNCCAPSLAGFGFERCNSEWVGNCAKLRAVFFSRTCGQLVVQTVQIEVLCIGASMTCIW